MSNLNNELQKISIDTIFSEYFSFDSVSYDLNKFSPKNSLIDNSEQENIAISNVEAEATVEGETTSTATVEAEAIAITDADTVGIENSKKIRFRKGNNAVVGTAAKNDLAISTIDAEAVAVGGNTATSTVDAVATATASGVAVGVDNSGRIDTERGHDVVVGTAEQNSEAISVVSVNTFSSGELEAFSTATVATSSFADGVAVGIDNSGRIKMGDGNDVITGTARQTSDALSGVDAGEVNITTAANSIAVGIDNTGRIETGKGHDVITGTAESNSLAISDAYVEADFAGNLSTVAEAKIEVTAAANGVAIGIDNIGRIDTGKGNDVIVGTATTNSEAEAIGNIEITATAGVEAIATAQIEATAIANGVAVGIDNAGRIDTGDGNDVIIGVASVNTVTVASAVANADAFAETPISDTATDSLADSLDNVGIGIDNSGKINTGNGNDRILGYGTTNGIINGTINTGNGHDYIHAARIELDPLTGQTDFSAEQTGAVENAKIFGGKGNDVFEIGGFKGKVLLDGGRGRDILKLSGSFDNYTIAGSSAQNNTVSFESSNSIMTVRNFEQFYFENELYTFSELV